MITVTNYNESNPIRSVGSRVMLICTIKLNPVVQNLTVKTVTINWRGPDGNNIESYDQPELDYCLINMDLLIFECEDFTYRSVVTVNSFKSGFYNCTAEFMAEHPYINNMQLSNGTRLPTGNYYDHESLTIFTCICIIGVYISLNKQFLSNGSIIEYTEISIKDTEHTDSLVCNTDKNGCCHTSNEGEWYLSDGSVVTRDFNVTRSDNGEIILFRKTGIISSPSTLCCRVPDARNMNQTVCVNSG